MILMSWVSLIPKAFGFIFSGSGKILLKLIALKLVMTSFVAILLAIVLLSSAVKQSMEEKSFKPFVFEFGELVLSVDSKINSEISSLENNTISLSRFLLVVSSEVWIYVVLFRVWYAILNFFTGSQLPMFIMLIFVAAILAAFQIIFSAVAYKTFYTPYTGIFNLITTIFSSVDFTKIKDDL